MSLCQLFVDLDSHADQRVTVRAAYRYGREVSGLYSEACSPPTKLDGVESVPHVYAVFSAKTMSSEPSNSIRERFNQALEESQTKPVSVVITVTGFLKTQSQAAPLVGKDGRAYKARMFGHLGAFPAEMTVESIDAVEVMSNSAAPANFALEAPKR